MAEPAFNEGLLDANVLTLDYATLASNIMNGISGAAAGYASGLSGAPRIAARWAVFIPLCGRHAIPGHHFAQHLLHQEIVRIGKRILLRTRDTGCPASASARITSAVISRGQINNSIRAEMRDARAQVRCQHAGDHIRAERLRHGNAHARQPAGPRWEKERFARLKLPLVKQVQIACGVGLLRKRSVAEKGALLEELVQTGMA